MAVIPHGEIDHGIPSVNIRMRLGEGTQIFYGTAKRVRVTSVGVQVLAQRRSRA
jgi:hypothetical protein